MKHTRTVVGEEAEDRDFVQAVNGGIADMEAGRVVPIDEAFERLVRELGLGVLGKTRQAV